MIINQQTFVQRLETLGYYTLPRTHPECPGYSGLLVVLRHTPKEHEPERIELRLHERDGSTPLIHLHAEIKQPFSYAVCPGKIVIRSKLEQEATFYTFGGSLESETLLSETVFSFRSAVPVLELLQDKETIADLLAAETEALFARAEAQQLLSSQQLLERLVKAGPVAVYLAVLRSLLPEDEDTAVYRFDSGFIKMLNRERTWNQKTGRWALNPHDLASLLSAEGNGSELQRR